MNLLETTEFRVSVNGDKSGETYMGSFKCLRRLSHRQELARDRKYRELLGENPDSASQNAKDKAEVFADLYVCLAEVPAWWKEAGFGIDLVDDNVISEVWSETIKIRLAAIKEVQDKGKAAEARLKEMAEKQEVVKNQ
jgi:hypothetical protein